MNIKYFYIGLFFVSHLVVSQQEVKKDSIIKLISSAYDLALNGHYGKALEQNDVALKIATRAKDTQFICRIYNNIGLTHGIKGEHETAIGYFDKALKNSLKINDKFSIVNAYTNLGITHAALNDTLNAKKSYQLGLEYCKTDLEKSSIYHNLGYLYLSENKYTKALNYFLTCLEIEQQNPETKRHYRITSIHYNLLNTYINLNDKENAKYHYKSGLELSIKHNFNLLTKDFYELKLDYIKKFNEQSSDYYHITDSLLSISELIKEEEELELYKKIESEYKVKEAENSLSEVKKEKEFQETFSITLLILITALIIFGLLLWRKNRAFKKLNSELVKAKNRAENTLYQKNQLEILLDEIHDDIIKDIQDNLGNKTTGIVNSYEILQEIVENKDFESNNYINFKNNLDKNLKELSIDLKEFILLNKSKADSLNTIVENFKSFINVYKSSNKLEINFSENLEKSNDKLPKYWNLQLSFILKSALQCIVENAEPDKITVDIKTENNVLNITYFYNGNYIKTNEPTNQLILNSFTKRAKSLGFKITSKSFSNKTLNSLSIKGELPDLIS